MLPGKVPIRADGDDRGARPRSGSDGAHEWTGYIPTEQLPAQFDPPEGVIVTANNAAVDAGYPYFVAAEWDPGYRAARIAELIDEAAAGGGLTVEEMGAIQNDTRITRADASSPPRRERRRDARRRRGPAADHRLGRHVGRSTASERGVLRVRIRLLRGCSTTSSGDLAREYVGADSHGRR